MPHHSDPDFPSRPRTRIKLSGALGAVAGAGLALLVASMLPVTGLMATVATAALVAVFSATGMLLGAHHLGYGGKTSAEREAAAERALQPTKAQAVAPSIVPTHDKLLDIEPSPSVTYIGTHEETPQTFHRDQLAASRALMDFDHTRAPRC